MNLQDLPVETIVRVFLFLDYNDLLSISCLSHFFRDVYDNFPELQYSFDLQVSGSMDMLPSVSTRHKLEELERREHAWRAMDLSRRVTVKVPHRTSHIYDLSGGVYLLGDCKNSIISRETHTLRFFDLSSCASGPDVRNEPWPEMKIDANIVDIGFGLNEFDLVAVVGIRHGRNGESGSIVLSLRELSTGAPHPLARKPDIIVDPLSEDRGKLSIMLEIVGPRLLLLLTWHRPMQFQRFLHEEQDKLLLFNWWEGTKIMAESAPQSTWNGFVLISPELALLPDKERGLEIIRLPDVTKGYSSQGFERLLRLSLPNLQPLVKVGGIQCRAEPNPFGTPHPTMIESRSETEFAQRMREKKRSPVAPDPMKAVVLLQIYYREFNNEPHDVFMGQWGVLRHNVSVVVHREFLLQLVDMFANKPPPPLLSTLMADASANVDAPTTTSSSDDSMDVDTDAGPKVEVSVPTVPWPRWGPHARWMADDTHVSNWITTSAGQRYVGADEEGHIIVKDFNPISVRHARAAVAATQSDDNGNGMTFEWESDGSRSRASYDFGLGFDDFESWFRSQSDTEQEHYRENAPSPEYAHSLLIQEMDEGASTSEVSESRRTASTPRTSLSPARPLSDSSWQSIRVIEGYNEVEDIELRQLFSEECKWPLPCVEYISRNTYEFHGLLMDEERIIGLRHDLETGAIVEFDVFTL